MRQATAFESNGEKRRTIAALKKVEKHLSKDDYAHIMLCVIGTEVDEEWALGS